MSPFPTISVIMTCYMQEQQEWFHQAVNAILNQQGVEVQLILSTVEGDACLEWIKQHNGDIDLVITSEKDHPGRGPMGSFFQINAALPCIRHEWMSFASANNVEHLDKYSREINLALLSGKLVCWGNLDIAESDLRIWDVSRLLWKPDMIYENNGIPDRAVMRYTKLKKFLPFVTTWYNCCYWDLWIRIYNELGDVFCHLDETTSIYRRNEFDMSVQRHQDKELMEYYDQQRQAMLISHGVEKPISIMDEYGD